jgi:arsenate reductase
MQVVTIWHNARCSNSRRALELIRDAGFEPNVVDYLNDPPDRATLVATLDDPGIEEPALIEAMLRKPALINRPIVITDRGTRLCRPPELVLEILPT